MTARPIPAELGGKLAELLPLLGSDKAGEVVAAACAIGRTLGAGRQNDVVPGALGRADQR